MDQPFVAAAGPPACWENENWHTECLHWHLFVEKMKIGMSNVLTGIYLWTIGMLNIFTGIYLWGK